MNKLRIYRFTILLVMSFLIPTSLASQNPGTQPVPTASEASDEEVLKAAAALVRKSQYGSEAFGAAMREMTTLLAKHHDSAVAPLLSAILDGMHEKDATHNLMLAMFYLYKHGSNEGAETRLRLIVEKYPKYSRLDEVLYQMSQLEYESGRRAEAIQRLEKLIGGYAYSPRIREAESKLKAFKSGK